MRVQRCKFLPWRPVPATPSLANASTRHLGPRMAVGARGEHCRRAPMALSIPGGFRTEGSPSPGAGSTRGAHPAVARLVRWGGCSPAGSYPGLINKSVDLWGFRLSSTGGGMHGEEAGGRGQTRAAGSCRAPQCYQSRHGNAAIDCGANTAVLERDNPSGAPSRAAASCCHPKPCPPSLGRQGCSCLLAKPAPEHPVGRVMLPAGRV